MRRRGLFMAAITAVALLLSACTQPGGSGGSSQAIGSDGCTPVVVATSSEKVNLMDELGQAFKKSPEASKLSKCATIAPISVASGKVASTLSANTKEWTLSTDKSTWPVIWSPASTVWTDRVASLVGPGIVDGAQSFTHTPVVFGVPESMAKALGWPDKPIGIKDIEALIAGDGWAGVGKPMWGAFKISKTNPNTSTTGLSMLLMQTYAASGKTSDLTIADVAAAESFSRTFESAAIHYGDTTGQVLQNLYDGSRGTTGSSYVSAIALEETSLYNYNLGNPDSHTVQPGEQLTPPSEKLIAIYPSEGSMWSDNPAVVLGTPWVTSEQKTAAQAFVAFLHTKTAQEILPKYGFRPLDTGVDPSGTLNASVGIDTAKPTITLGKPDAPVVSAALDQWTQIRKPSAVLELIDISGSMNDKMSDGRTKLSGAIQGAQSTLDNFRATDEIGVWAFTTNLNGPIDGQAVPNLVSVRDFAPLGGGKEDLRNGIGDLANATHGGTPMYDALSYAYDYMKARADEGRINAIVLLSDGEDTNSSTTIDSLIQKIRADATEGGNNKSVRIFAIAYGADANIDQLRRLAQASGGQVFNAKDPTKINEVFQSVMNNF